jgi:branched-chain amino acid transport system ATP-binding protein
VQELQAVLRAIKLGGVMLLIVEQRINFALALADRIYLMSKGQVEHETSPDLLRSDGDLRLRYLGV